MAKKAGIVANLTYNSVALEGSLTDVSQDVKMNLLNVKCLGDTGPKKIADDYDWSYALSGLFDGASGSIDATLWAQLGTTGAATTFQPTGAVPGANDPNYTSTLALLESYSIKAAVGAAVTVTATLQGGSALTRAVA